MDNVGPDGLICVYVLMDGRETSDVSKLDSICFSLGLSKSGYFW